ncbi:MAG: 5'/3'-nucleotidase SurE [Chlamydiae bacterium]|nr:5'/3'-nucleotidase SurE [Chlamydiota bacterium]
MNIKPNILLTNDDGIHAPGLMHLWKAVADFAKVTIVAPSVEKSGVGAALTLREPLSIDAISWEKNTHAWKITGTPVDCVRLATSLLLEKKPDLILSGINRGSNAGRNVLYSGTIGGIIEGAFRGIQGIAFSCEDYDNPQYQLTEKYLLKIVQHILNHPLTPGTILNVNFPHLPIKGIKLARQGQGYWIENPEKRVNPDGDPYYWQGGKWDEKNEHEESDVALLKQGYIAAVPIHVGEMTDHHFFKERKEHFENHFNL